MKARPSPDRDFLEIIAEAPQCPGAPSPLDLLARGLNRAGAIWRGDATLPPLITTPRELLAAWVAVGGLMHMLIAADPEDVMRCREPVAALGKALDDLIHSREPPVWIRPPKLWDRAPDGLGIWGVRAEAALRLQQLIDLKTARKDAQKAVHDVLHRHGFPCASPSAVYGWLRRLREGRAPVPIVTGFTANLAEWRRFPGGADPERYRPHILAYLAEGLEASGYFARR